MNKSQKLTLVGTGLFLLSFFLPSYAEASGFYCAWFCLTIIQNGFDLGSIFYFSFSFPNLLMLTLPFLVFVHYRNRPFPRWLIGLQGLFLVYSLSWWLIMNALGSIAIGYYVWVGSMALLLWATWMTRKKPDPVQENPEASQAPA